MRLRPPFRFPALSGRLAPFTLVVAVALASCADVTVPPRIFVSKVPSNVHVAREDGSAMPVNRWDLDPHAGLTRGYWAIRSDHEWRALWPSLDADRIPLLPPDIDFGKELLLVAAPTDLEVTDVRIHAVIDTAEAGIHVYLSQTVPGQGCPPPPKDDRVPVNTVRVPKFDKEIHFHVEVREDTPCEAPPEAKVGCRMSGPSDAFSDKLVVEPGKIVSCLSQGKPGLRPTVDRTWSFRKVPMGTATKMTISPSGSGVTFPTDAYGTYAVGLDVTDDLGRTSNATNEVQVTPPKDALVVQMLWTKFDPSDDPSTFPRIELHVAGDKTPIPVSRDTTYASRNQPWILIKGDCVLGAEKLPEWCEAHTIGSTWIERVQIDAFPQYRIGVKYLDDRYDGQPVLCVRTFRGELASEWCDKAVRKAGSWWDSGRLDAQTGKPPVPPTPPPTADAGAAQDAGGGAVPAGTPVPTYDPSKPRKPGEPWQAPGGTGAAKPAGTGTGPGVTPSPKAAGSAAAPAKTRQPGDPWTP